MLKSFLCISSAVLLGISAFVVFGAYSPVTALAAGAGKKTSSTTSAQTLARAKEVYKVDCAVCHGANGNGKTDLATSMQVTLDDWTDPKTLAAKSNDDLFKIIRDGEGKMPSEPAGRANDADVRGLIQYIRSMAVQQPAAPATAATPTAPAAGK